jgi:hypothetical protein
MSDRKKYLTMLMKNFYRNIHTQIIHSEDMLLRNQPLLNVSKRKEKKEVAFILILQSYFYYI